jgi:hypothetical protein
MRVGILAVFVTVLAMRVGRGRVPLCLIVLPVGVVVRGLQVVMCRRMVVRRRRHVMLDGRMLMLLWHGASSWEC